MVPSDRLLYEQWRATRDADAFAELVARHADMVYSVCKRVLRSAADAEDAAQECFMALMEGRVKVGESLAPWLYTVAFRRAHDIRRRIARIEKLAPHAVVNIDTAAKIETQEILDHVDKAIAQLPEFLRTPLIERFLNARNHADIAAHLGVSESTIRYRLDKAVERIRETLTKQGVRTTSALLFAVLGGRMAEAAPSSLTAAIGKLAISGVHSSTVPVLKPILEAFIVKKTVVVGAILVVAFAIGISVNQRVQNQRRPQEEAKRSHSQTERPPFPPTQDVVLTNSSIPAKVVAADIKLEHCEIADPSRYCSISGKVVDDTGAIVPDAEVFVVCQGYDDKESPQTMLDWCKRAMDKGHHFRSKSNSTGSYEVTGIRFRGEAYVSARKDGRNSAFQRVIFQEGSALTEIELKFGSEPKHRFLGRVLSPTNVPVIDAVVRLVGHRGGFAYSGSDGVFEIAMQVSTFSDFVCVYSPTVGMASFEVIPDGHEEIVDLKMPGLAALVGKIGCKDSRLVSGLRVRLQGGLARWETGDDGTQTRTTTAIDMSYESDVAENGEYRIGEIDSGQYYYEVTVIDERNTALTNSELGYLQPNTEAIWNATIEGSAHVFGVVRSQTTNKPLTDGRIRVWASQNDRFIQDVFIDKSGGFSMDLPAISGSYLICPSFDPFVFHGFESFGKQVSVAHGEEKQVDLVFMDTCTYPIRVVNERGLPVPMAGIYRIQLDNEYLAGKTDDNGQFTCEGIMPNFNALKINVQLRVRKSGYCEGCTQWRVGEPGTVFPKEMIVLYPAAGLRGKLQYSDGTAVSNTPIAFTMNLSNGDICEARATTKSDGSFELLDKIPATKLGIELKVDVGGATAPQTLPVAEIDYAPGDILELGTLQLDPLNSESEES